MTELFIVAVIPDTVIACVHLTGYRNGGAMVITLAIVKAKAFLVNTPPTVAPRWTFAFNGACNALAILVVYYAIHLSLDSGRSYWKA